MTTPGSDGPGDGPEESDSGLARERTALSWTRTAISFAALGGTLLKENVITGLVVLAIAPVVWQIGRVTRAARAEPGGQPTAAPMVGATRLFGIAVSIVVVALLCLVVAILGRSAPGALR
ncbi:MAG TPA: DUF202 domain-containing protein [Trebonia sp.]|jgi:uncharacterized membrane protein YidH (DUF202 family)|nr:DUF202 domain-containing protein [Trebonia sp.]